MVESGLPLMIKCSECGYLFYFGLSIESIDAVLKPFQSCPRCGKKVSKDSSSYKISIELPEETQGR